MKIEVRFFFEPRDAWVGLFWRTAPGELEVFLCLLPFLPIHFRFRSAGAHLAATLRRRA